MQPSGKKHAELHGDKAFLAIDDACLAETESMRTKNDAGILRCMMKFPISRMSKRTLFGCVFVLMLVSLVFYAVYDRFIEQKNAIATIEPWNFTPEAIDDIYVNGQWGGSVHGHSGGAGAYAAPSFRKYGAKTSL